jgi:adenylate kinase family enzyme
MAPLVGTRIVVVGPTCSGKSTLAATLAERLDVPFVELDALFWLPDWVESDDETFGARVEEATAGETWAVAGSYRRVSEHAIWPRAETMIWLDFPLPLVLRRVLVRSWRRWRSGELLWGTNYERFWTQLFSRDSLLLFAVRNHRRNRRRWIEMMADPRWAHVNFVQLRGPAETAGWLARTAPPRADGSGSGPQGPAGGP